MATKYTVSRNDAGSQSKVSEHDDLRSAIRAAAELARVTRRTVQRRISDWTHPSGCYQVGGREIGDAGVWIEYE